MAGLASVVLLSLELEDINLGFLAILYDLRFNSSTLNIRSASSDALFLTNGKNLIKGNGIALSGVKLLHKDNVAFLYFLLFSAGFNNCVQSKAPLFHIRLAVAGGLRTYIPTHMRHCAL